MATQASVQQIIETLQDYNNSNSYQKFNAVNIKKYNRNTCKWPNKVLQSNVSY